MYGLAIWGGLALGPIAGEAAYALGGFDAVWAFSALSPLLGACVVLTVADRRAVSERREGGRLLPPAALRPGAALFLPTSATRRSRASSSCTSPRSGSATGRRSSRRSRAAVVFARLALAWLPDRVGPRTTAIAAALGQAAGLALIAAAGGLGMAVAGALVMGAGFSLLFPSLALLVVERVDEQERGAAMGAFTSFFDLGVGIGAPLAGAVSALAGYPAAFAVAAACAALSAVLAASVRISPPAPGRRRKRASRSA